MVFSKPHGRHLAVLRMLQVICIIATPIVVARFLFSDVVWVTALVIDAVGVLSIALLYWLANSAVDEPEREDDC